jgi:hypothetical protein
MLKVFQKSIEKIANFFFGTRNEESFARIAELLEEPDDLLEEIRERKVLPAAIHDSEKELVQKINKDKRAFFERALENGIATLYLDPRVAGVVVPDSFAGNATLVLNYSYKYNVSDFFFDDFSIVATLSFSRFPFKCIIPWSSVFGIGNQSEGIFCKFSEFPEESLGNAPEKKMKAIKGGKEDHFDIVEHKKPKLVLIKGGKE